jgi:hypothetical protein
MMNLVRLLRVLFPTVLVALPGCGKTADEGPAKPAGSSCAEHADVAAVLSDAAPSTLPKRLAGTLCDESDALVASITLEPELQSRPLRLSLAAGAGSMPHHVTFWGYDEARAVVKLETRQEMPAPALSAVEPELFVDVLAASTETPVAVALAGPPGEVALDIERPERPPALECDGEYESLPPSTPARVLPTELELELCNARDSRVFGLEVVADREVEITLENPLAIDAFDLAVVQADTDAWVSLPTAFGTTRDTLGLVARRSLRFTPDFTGRVALYCSLGRSLGDKVRLTVRQD